MTRFGAGLVLIFSVMLATQSAGAQQVDSSAPDTTHKGTSCGACINGVAIGLHPPTVALPDTGRPHAIEYSDAYAVRLKIHQIGSYIELPLFAAEYLIGNKLLNDTTTYTSVRGAPQSSLRGWHNNIAAGLGLLFATNTVTGLWNLIESRHDPAGGVRKWLHSIAMLAADAGFVLTANAGGAARRTISGADNHRNLAIGSMGLATLSTLMMWLWKD